MYLVKDLLNRDEKELALFKENSEKFSSDTNAFNELLHNKLLIQQRKVDVKKMILENLQSQLLIKI
jgi:hypothetical protein